MNDKPWTNGDQTMKIAVVPYRETDRLQPGKTITTAKTNLYVAGLPSGITEAQIRSMFEEFGPVRSILLKSAFVPTEYNKPITPLLPIYSMAYVNFETEAAALAAFALNKRDPMSPVKVAYYNRGTSSQMNFVQTDPDVRGNTNYRILFIRKLNRKVSLPITTQTDHLVVSARFMRVTAFN